MALPTSYAIARGWPIIAGQGVSSATYDPAAEALFSAMSVQPNAGRKTLISNCIASLKAGGVWSLIDLLHVPAAHDPQAGRLNWKDPATVTLSEVNSPGWVTDRGYAGDGATSYVATGYTTATGGEDNTHIGAFVVDQPGAGGFDYGDPGNRHLVRVIAGNISNAIKARGNTASTLTGGAANPSHKMGVRRVATEIITFDNGAYNTATATAANSAAAGPLDLCRAASSYSSRRVAAAHTGLGLTDGQALALYNALRTYLTGLGVP